MEVEVGVGWNARTENGDEDVDDPAWAVPRIHTQAQSQLRTDEDPSIQPRTHTRHRAQDGSNVNTQRNDKGRPFVLPPHLIRTIRPDDPSYNYRSTTVAVTLLSSNMPSWPSWPSRTTEQDARRASHTGRCR